MTDSLSYSEIGATADPFLPDGYHHLRAYRELGRGLELFERLGEAVLTWQVQERAGLRRVAGPERARLGADVTFEVAGLRVPCRVVDLQEGPRRRGFSYGTRSGHPEVGEERFMVDIGDDGLVTGTITAFSRPGRWYTRAAGPAGRLVQRLVTRRYLNALEELARSSG